MTDQLTDAITPSQWGIRFKAREVWHDRKQGLPEGCPPWAKSYQQEKYGDHGLVVWNNVTQELEVLQAGEALALLDRLRSSETWKTDGDRITQRITQVYLDSESDIKPKRKKTKRPPPHESETPPDTANVSPKPLRKVFDREIIPLSPEACQAVLQFLQGHEQTLKDAALADERRTQQAFEQVYRMLFHQHRVHEIEEVPLTGRSLAWIRETGKTALVCEVPPNRATVTLTDGFFPLWLVCVERPHRFKHESPNFFKLTEALDWADKELTSAENIEELVEEEESFPASTVDLRPYEVSPAALEPPQIRYRALIELEREPIRSKKYEISFGEAFLYDKEYPTAIQLAHELKLGAERVGVEQIVKETGLYRIYTLTSFFNESLAMAQAQQFWDQSAIVPLYQAKQISWAFYGYQELETEYRVYLGGCEGANRSSPKPQPRAEYMAEKARRLTLIHALDLVGYRACLRMRKKWQSDEQLLRGMHEDRAQSPYLPLAAREESRRWLKEHPASVDR